MKLLAKKSLGQHFLTSTRVREQIITASDIAIHDTILEIGPGTGFLTESLLHTGARIIAVEKDERAYVLLQTKFSQEIKTGQLHLINADILKVDVRKPPFNFQSGSYSLIANIPYYITGAILELFLEHLPQPKKMVLLIQKEVADRILARKEQATGKSKESILSVSVKVFGTAKVITRVPKGAFNPPPSVDSAVLAIDHISKKNFETMLKEKPTAIELFFSIVRAGFAHKRKILKRNLEDILQKDIINEVWQNLSLPDHVRAEELSPEKWIEIGEQVIHHL